MLPRAVADNPALLVRLGLISVFASSALLILQQLSFRLLAPVIGSSVETWSTIIGVFLLGIALGNLAGGQLGRSRPRAADDSLVYAARRTGDAGNARRRLRGSSNRSLLADLPLATQIAIASLAVCFLPSFVLSLLTPLAIKAVLREASQAGRVTGLIFALGTVGSLVGNYLAGFVLIPLFDIHTIVAARRGRFVRAEPADVWRAFRIRPPLPFADTASRVNQQAANWRDDLPWPARSSSSAALSREHSKVPRFACSRRSSACRFTFRPASSA